MSRARRLLELTWSLAVTEFKLRYYGNALGYFWTLAKPLMIFGVLYVAFTEILKVGDSVPDYAPMLILAIVLYNFFAEATAGSVGSLVASGNLIRKHPVPTLAVPLSVVLGAFFTLAVNLIAVGVFIALSGVEVTSGWLQFPLILAALLIFTTAVSSVLANLFVPFRDIGQIWEVGLQLLFWATPIIYPIEILTNRTLQEAIMFNPLAVIVVQARHAVIDPAAPSASEVAGSGHVIVAGLIVLATLAAGALLYRRVRPTLAEQI